MTFAGCTVSDCAVAHWDKRMTLWFLTTLGGVALPNIG